MGDVFAAPPLTPDVLAALKLIAPELQVDATEAGRQTWERSYNQVSGGEYGVLGSLLEKLAPRRVLEIGPGLGRSLVYLSKMLNWEHADAYEGDGSRTRYTLDGPRGEDSWCGNIAILHRVLEHNGVDNVTVYDAADTGWADLPGPYDLIYSFYSVGFHWSLRHFLPDLLPLMGERTVGVFMVPPGYSSPKWLDGLYHRILDYPSAARPTWRTQNHAAPLPRFLVISRSELVIA